MRRFFSQIASVKQILKTAENGTNVCVRGWARSLRKQKSIAFIEIDDGTSVETLQIVVSDPKCIEGAGTGCSVEIHGQVVASQGRTQQKEIHANSVKIVGRSDASFPLQKKFHTNEYLRQLAHLRPKTKTFGAVSRIRSAASFHLQSILQENGFIHIHTPILTSNDCEGGGEQFLVTPAIGENGRKKGPPFFGQDAFLTVSGQLHVEAFAAGLSKVFSFGPTFRAENSNTPRHLAEFWMLEPEAAFFTNNDSMDLAERLVRDTVKNAIENQTEEIEFLSESQQAPAADTLSLKMLGEIASGDFERVKYHDAMSTLLAVSSKFELKPVRGEALHFEHEQYLARDAQRPVFVTDFPAGCKPFYCLKSDGDDGTVQCFDLLLPRIGEMVGGSAREHRIDVLQDAMLRKGGQSLADNLWWYLDLRRYGSVPTAGFGLGFDRLVMLLTGLTNVRDTAPIPRHVGNCRL